MDTFKIPGGKGQAGLMGGFMLIIAVGILVLTMLPTVNNFAERTAGNLTADGADPGSVLLVRLIPVFLVLAYLSSIFVVVRVAS